MNKALPIATSLLIASLFAGIAFAQETSIDSTTTTPTKPTSVNSLERLKQRAQSLQQKIDDKRASLSAKIADRKERIASREAAFKKFKDQKKADIAQRLETNFNNVNERRTDQMSKHLDVLTSIYNKLASRLNGNPKIASDSATQSALANAKAALDTAKQAVDAQKAKTYSVAASTEANIKTDARSVREAFKNDLKNTHQTVVGAKNAIKEIIKASQSSRRSN